ncbi:hypothetical protein ACOMHN_034226 [Nucella lapillus]
MIADVFVGRSPGYQLGFVGFLLCFVAYLVGFATRYWLETPHPRLGFSAGLWLVCLSDSCSFYFKVRNSGTWLHISRALSCSGVVMMSMISVYGLVSNLCLRAPRYTRSLEKCGGIGGVLSLSGTLLYLAIFYKFDPSLYRLAWSFYLAAISSAGVVLFCILLAFNNKPDLTLPSRQTNLAMVDTRSRVAQPQPPTAFGGSVIAQGGGAQFTLPPVTHAAAAAGATAHPAGSVY